MSGEINLEEVQQQEGPLTTIFIIGSVDGETGELVFENPLPLLQTSVDNRGNEQSDPPGKETYVSMVEIKEEPFPVAIKMEQEVLDVLEIDRVDDAPLEDNLLFSRSSTITSNQSNEENPQTFVPATQSGKMPPKYGSMSFAEFMKEMQDSINQIIQESLGLFQKDPREYHPFYLRIFKYVTIGQRLGYVSGEEGTVIKEIWGEFLQLAKTNYEKAIHTPVVCAGVKSPYATYLLTKMVVINDKVVTIERDERSRNKQFRELEITAKRLKDEWTQRNLSGADIKEDVQLIFSFFKECQMITFPGDTLKMNNIWSKLLGGGKPTKGRVSYSNQSIKSKADKVTTGNRTSPRKLPVKVGVQSPLNPSSSKEAIELSCLSPSSPPSRGPPHTPPGALDGVSTPKFNPNRKRKMPTTSSIVASAPVENSKTSAGRSPVNGSLHFPQNTLSKIKRRKVALAPGSESKLLVLQRKTKKKILGLGRGKPVSWKPDQLTGSRMARQVRLERFLLEASKNKPAVSKLATQKKRSLCDTSSGQQKPKLSTTRKFNKSETKLCSPQGTTDRPSLEQHPGGKRKLKSAGAPTKSKISKKNISGGNDEENDSETQRKQKDDSDYVQCEFCSSLKRKNKNRSDGIWAHVQQEHSEQFEEWVGRELEKKRQRSIMAKRMIRRKLREEGVGPDWLIRDRQRVPPATKKKFRQMNLNCVVCHKSVGLVSLSQHLKRVHGIVEDGDLWQCTLCTSGVFSRFATRESWVAHMELKHKSKISMEEVMRIAKKINNVKLVPPSPRSIPAGGDEHESLVDPEGREKCDQCSKLYDPSYLPTHQQAVHESHRLNLRCPACPKSYKNGFFLWHHYCTYHLQEGELAELDPVPVELRGRFIGRYPRQPAMFGGDSGEPASSFCELCGVEYASMVSLSRHMYMVHGEGQRKENYWQCAQCPKQFKDKDALNAHAKRIHEGVIISKCPHCSRDVQTSGKLFKHLVDCHNISPPEAAAHCEVEYIPCPVCGEVFLAGRQFKNHVNSKHPEQAADLMKSSQELTKGVPRLRRPRPEGTSEEWKAPGMSRKELTRQRQIQRKRELVQQCRETGSGPAWVMEKLRDAGTCPECGKECTKALSFHRLKEHGVALYGGYSCPLEGCKMTTKSKKTLLVHIRVTHAAPMEEVIVKRRIVKVVEKASTCTIYQCLLCQNYLYDYDEIKVHMVVFHPEIFKDFLESKTIEFPCPYCEERSKSDELLRIHAEVSHPEMCLRCPECSRTLLNPDDMDKHFREEHEDVADGGGRIRVVEEELFLKARRVVYTGTEEEILPSVAPKMNKHRIDKVIASKYKLRSVKCEICQRDMRITHTRNHFLQVHGIREDNDKAFVCDKCPETREFSCGERIQWLCHMHKFHEKEVDMEKLMEEVGNVRTKVPWSTLAVKNLEGKTKSNSKASREDAADITADDEEDMKGKRFKGLSEATVTKNRVYEKTTQRVALRRSGATRKNYRKLAGEEGSSEESDCEMATTTKRRNDSIKTTTVSVKRRGANSGPLPNPSAPPVRVSGRKRKPVTKYRNDSDDDDFTEGDPVKKKTAISGGACRSARRMMTDKLGGSGTTSITMEGDKRLLLIKVERLPEEQFKMYWAKANMERKESDTEH